MLGAIRYGLANLLNFSGRDARTTYWYYVLFLYLTATVLTIALMAPAYVRMMSVVMRLSFENPENVQAINTYMALAMGDMMESMFSLSLFYAAFHMILLAASLVRRLHDSDLSGYWALVPAGFLLLQTALMPGYISDMKSAFAGLYSPDPAHALRALGQFSSPVLFLGLIPLAFVVVAGVRQSTAGPNAYGEAPVRFR